MNNLVYRCSEQSGRSYTNGRVLKKRRLHFLIFFGIPFFLSISLSVFSQTRVIAKIDSAAKFITADNLDNIYVVTLKNELLKYNAAGKFLWRYSNKSFGELERIDVTDPLRILLFYPAYQQAVVLNNNLNEITKYRFSQDPSKLITLIATANTNGYWIYDQVNRELLKLAGNFSGEQQSGNIYQQTGIDLKPDVLKATDQFVYLHDPQKGVLEFDRFGKYSRVILTDELTDFEINDFTLRYLNEGRLKTLNLKTYETSLKPLPVAGALQIATGNKLMGVLTEKGVFLLHL